MLSGDSDEDLEVLLDQCGPVIDRSLPKPVGRSRVAGGKSGVSGNVASGGGGHGIADGSGSRMLPTTGTGLGDSRVIDTIQSVLMQNARLIEVVTKKQEECFEEAQVKRKT